MTELEIKIYESIKLKGQYNFSIDMEIKLLELKAIKSLVNNGYITVHSNSLGYILAKAL